jgi:predicted transcriptional regulator
MTTLDRLYHKGILRRKRVGGRFLYSARLSREELTETTARAFIASMLAGSKTSRGLTVLSLVEALRQRDPRLFEEKVATLRRANSAQKGGV